MLEAAVAFVREHEQIGIGPKRRLPEPAHVIVDDRAEIAGEPLLVERATAAALAPDRERAWRGARQLVGADRTEMDRRIVELVDRAGAHGVAVGRRAHDLPGL